MARTLALLALSFSFCLLRPAAGDEPKPEEKASPLRLFHVDALLAGRSNFLGERTGIVPVDGVSDEERPLFGAEGEEPLLPVGTMDELIELLKSEVDPDSWASVSGVDISAFGGTLIVKQTSEAHDALGAALKRWEDRWLRTVTVDVQAVRIPVELGGEALTSADLATLAQKDDAGPGLTLCAFPGQRVTAFAGRRHAFVEDYDVEVAETAKGSDPVVGVVGVGLTLDLRAVASGSGERVLLALNGALTELVAAPRVPAVDKGEIETPRLRTLAIRTRVELRAGAWTRIDGAGIEGGAPGWSMLVRARVNPRVSDVPTRGDSLPVLQNAGIGKMERRSYDIASLQEPIPSFVGREIGLSPSNFTPPEPPELPEPQPAIPVEVLQELVRTAIAPEVWEKGTVRAQAGSLNVRAPEAVHAVVGRMLTALRKSLLWSVEVDAEVVDVPVGLLRDETPLSEASVRELAAALEAGEARRLDRVHVSSMRGARNNVAVGQERTYVKDYDVELAKESVIGNPIVETLFSGIVLDIQPAIDSTGNGAAITVRFSRSSVPEVLPSFPTPYGPVQVPEMADWRIRTSVEAPFGRTTVVAGASERGRRTVLLLTPRLRRAGE